jgi:hypothetical protein
MCSVVVQCAAERNSLNKNSNIRIQIFKIICLVEYKASDCGVSMSTLRYNIQLEAQIISKELVTEVSDRIFVPVLLSAILN